jgi:hypothetical protein
VITSLKGTVTAVEQGVAVLEVGGPGLRALIPASTTVVEDTTC